jgi:hypothetical protein
VAPPTYYQSLQLRTTRLGDSVPLREKRSWQDASPPRMRDWSESSDSSQWRLCTARICELRLLDVAG